LFDLFLILRGEFGVIYSFVGCMEFMMDMICMGIIGSFFTDYLTGQLCCLLFFSCYLASMFFCLFGVADTEGAEYQMLGSRAYQNLWMGER
jgi:uncharacterized membrane protein YeaQ/YmgE (transglycosylase-associated protein family)